MLSSRQILIALAIKHNGIWQKIYEDIQNKVVENLESYYEQYEKCSFSAVTIIDSDYPKVYKEIYMPPFVLFYYGDISLLSEPDRCVSVVGSRNPTRYGEEITKKLVHGISKKYIIVSGMAKGIDGIAHRCALMNKGKTIGILGSGIDYCYPSENKDIYEQMKNENLLISEYFADSMPDKEHFPLRNRLIAAASKVTLVTEAKKQSGSSITATYALSFGRTVMACPANADTNSSCNKLIKEGAILVENEDDIIEEMQGCYLYQKEKAENVK